MISTILKRACCMYLIRSNLAGRKRNKIRFLCIAKMGHLGSQLDWGRILLFIPTTKIKFIRIFRLRILGFENNLRMMQAQASSGHQNFCILVIILLSDVIFNIDTK